MRTCQKCGAASPDEALYCLRCGERLAERCARCGTELPPAVQFCPACGARVSLDEPPQERKLITVLFADLTGSTNLGERLDPEELKEVLASFFGAMSSEIEAEGGTVEMYIGDAIMSVFGVPVVHEDDPSRALRAAVGMRGALDRLNEALIRDHNLTLEMRIGVHTGEVLAVTEIRPGEAMAIGDTMNVAARLEQNAQPGQTLVSERTARASAGFELVEVGPLLLRGKSDVVHTFSLVGYGGSVERYRLAAPMVGREKEMSLLTSIFERVGSEGRPHLVTIYGDAGVGKSRFVSEFVSGVEREARPAKVVRSRCLPQGEGTYRPLAQILREPAGVLDSDEPQEASAKIRRAAEGVLADSVRADAERMAAALAVCVGLEGAAGLEDMGPRRIRQEIHEAWRAYFSALASTAPTVVLLEDLHWASPALLDLVEELAGRVEGSVLFLCTARLELLSNRAAWGAAALNSSTVLLDPLSQSDSARLVSFLLSTDSLPARFRDQILERAGGNPFFLEEIVQHLIDGGRLVASGSGWKATGGEAPVEIPDNVQAVLAARIDLLAPSDKRVLRSAAVVGRSFWPGAIAGLVAMPLSELESALERLEGRGMVIPRVSSSIEGEREYLFRHVLTRDVAYEGLPRKERARAHASVAAWLDERSAGRGSELVELLASHYGEAYRGMAHEVPADRERLEQLRVRALTSALRASESLRSKFALDRAEELAEAASSLASGPRESSEAEEARGRVFVLEGMGDLAWQAFKKAIDLRLESSDEDEQAIVRLCIAALELATRGRATMGARLERDAVTPYLEQARSRVPEGDGEERARLLVVESFWPHSFSSSAPSDREILDAADAGEQAAAMAMRLQRPDLACAALDGVATPQLLRGLYGRAWDVMERRLELAPSLEDPGEAGDVFAVAAWAAFHIGKYAEAARLADEGFLRAKGGAPANALHCLDWRAQAKFRLGDWTGFMADASLARELLGDRSEHPPGFAVDHLAAAAFVHETQGDREAADRLLTILRWLAQGDEPASQWRSAWLALLLSRRGEHDEALAELDRPEFAKLQYGRGLRLEVRCDILAAAGRWNEAAVTVAAAREHAAEAGLLALPVFAERFEGRAAAAEGRWTEAAQLLERAASGFAELQARWEEACTDLDRAEALRQSGDADGARSVLGKATPTLTELGSVRELARSEALVVALGSTDTAPRG